MTLRRGPGRAALRMTFPLCSWIGWGDRRHYATQAVMAGVGVGDRGAFCDARVGTIGWNGKRCGVFAECWLRQRGDESQFGDRQRGGAAVRSVDHVLPDPAVSAIAHRR